MATSIRLAPETEQRLDFLATSTGRTKAYYLGSPQKTENKAR